MKKKIIFLFAVFTLFFALGNTSHALAGSNDNDGNYLKIFTPEHKVKSVLSTYYENISGVQSKKIYIDKDKPVFQRQFSQKEIDLVAKIVHAESKGEPFIGKVAVASVILNRLSHPEFPKTVEGVIFEKNAFSCIDDRYDEIQPDIEAYKAVDEALNGNDPTGNAVFFYNPNTASCKWMKKTSKNEVKTIGNHVFFR